MDMIRSFVGTFAIIICTSAMAQETDDDLWAKATPAFKAMDYATAAAVYVKLAKRGDQDAMYWLGRLHEQGLGVKRDRRRAQSLFREARKSGSKLARIRLAAIYSDFDGRITYRADDAVVDDFLSQTIKCSEIGRYGGLEVSVLDAMGMQTVDLIGNNLRFTYVVTRIASARGSLVEVIQHNIRESDDKEFSPTERHVYNITPAGYAWAGSYGLVSGAPLPASMVTDPIRAMTSRPEPFCNTKARYYVEPDLPNG